MTIHVNALRICVSSEMETSLIHDRERDLDRSAIAWTASIRAPRTPRFSRVASP